MPIDDFSNVMIDKTTGGSGDYTSTDPATANFINKDGAYFAQAWEPINTALDPIFTKQVFGHTTNGKAIGYLDSAGDFLKGYLVAGNTNDWMATAASTCAEMTYGSTLIPLTCIQRGRVPLITPNSSCTGTATTFDIAPTAAGAIYYKPFYYTTATSSTLTLTRTDSALTIGSTSFGPDKFRGGVVPTQIYAVVVGGGGGGGGTWGNTSCGGGGAGGAIGAVLDLEAAAHHGATVYLSAGSGGAGGYKKETSTTAGLGKAGGYSRISVSNSSYYQPASITAYGGNPGGEERKAGSGGTTGYQQLFLTPADGAGQTIFRNITNCTGGAGSTGTVNGTGGSTTSANWAPVLGKYPLSTNNTLHACVTPLRPSGGEDCDDNTNSISGGGGASIMRRGGAGGLNSSSTDDGKPGGTGAGGGGAHYIFANYNRGGDGGSGAILLYY